MREPVSPACLSSTWGWHCSLELCWYVEVFFIHHLYMEVSLIKTELAVRAVGASDRPNGPSSDGLALGDIGKYIGID